MPRRNRRMIGRPRPVPNPRTERPLTCEAMAQSLVRRGLASPLILIDDRRTNTQKAETE